MPGIPGVPTGAMPTGTMPSMPWPPRAFPPGAAQTHSVYTEGLFFAASEEIRLCYRRRDSYGTSEPVTAITKIDDFFGFDYTNILRLIVQRRLEWLAARTADLLPPNKGFHVGQDLRIDIVSVGLYDDNQPSHHRSSHHRR